MKKNINKNLVLILYVLVDSLKDFDLDFNFLFVVLLYLFL